ncbi:hypothetical protein PHYC_04012 [Phycisphaerales bacterium]|nr:hypothetical protein PHYC_04012 [Phycisphaerales bacterium]
MAGYSKTPLARKLGIKPGSRVVLLGAPAGFERTLGDLPKGAKVTRRAPLRAVADVILLFTNSSEMLEDRFPRTRRRLAEAGGFWVCWPKKASGVPTDLTEDLVRGIGLEVGLVDNKVCAVDEVWSGLRFVVRVRDRKA